MMKDDVRILKKWEKEFKKGLISYLILLLLLDKEMYGYELTSTLNELSRGQITYRESGIYQVLKRLGKKKLLTTFDKPSPRGPARKYYRITPRARNLVNRFTRQYVISFQSQLDQLIRKQVRDK
jgi:PadR family transcriptional regulator PadR